MFVSQCERWYSLKAKGRNWCDTLMFKDSNRCVKIWTDISFIVAWHKLLMYNCHITLLQASFQCPIHTLSPDFTHQTNGTKIFLMLHLSCHSQILSKNSGDQKALNYSSSSSQELINVGIFWNSFCSRTLRAVIPSRHQAKPKPESWS